MTATRSEQTLFGLLVASIVVAVSCGGASRRVQGPKPADCGEASAVALDDAARTGGAFTRLLGTHKATLSFRCPDQSSCALPPDTELTFTVAPERSGACEFASCRVPYLGNLPFSRAGDETCPNVLWSLAEVRLHSDAGALDEEAHEVNMLAHANGEGYLRFMVESPRALTEGPGLARSVLLDVQLESTPQGMRGQLSALAAPLEADPGAELRYRPLWTATWERPN
ncbi:MAG TPA: hypothetical protein VFX59_02775 [Polyangiales bacterium]|nr:hypothetical protein [Polyangiales bacterium]